MTTAEILSTSIAFLALMISSITAYFTLLARFQGNILPRRRVILTQIETIPYLGLECEFVNDGAKPGLIEDLSIDMMDETGKPTTFLPFYFKEIFNIADNYSIRDYIQFTGQSLSKLQRYKCFVFFRPSGSDFKPNPGITSITTNFCLSIEKNKWKRSIVGISMDLKEDNIKEWVSPNGKPQLIPSIEIRQNRQIFLGKSRR